MQRSHKLSGRTREWVKKRENGGMFAAIKELSVCDTNTSKYMTRKKPKQFDKNENQCSLETQVADVFADSLRLKRRALLSDKSTEKWFSCFYKADARFSSDAYLN